MTQEDVGSLPIEHPNFMKEVDLYWLAGFLEGEGSFCKGTPSSPNSPYVCFSTTDKDVAEKACALFGNNCHNGRVKNHDVKGWKTPWIGRLKGSKAVDLMKRLRPLLGERRKKQVDRAVSSFKWLGPQQVTKELVDKIKKELATTSLHQKDIAKMFGVCRETVCKINTGWRDKNKPV